MTQIRIAIAATGKAAQVAKYMPLNYRVIGRTLDNTGTIIMGVDDHGWTMDDYIIPRLGSGMIHCEEITHTEGIDWGKTWTQFPAEFDDDTSEPELHTPFNTGPIKQ